MGDKDIAGRVGELAKAVERFPYCVAVMMIYTLALALVSLLVVRLGFWDSLLYLFLVPCILSAFFFGRRVYLSMQALLVVAAIWVTSLVSSDFQTSLVNTVFMAATSALITEAIRGLVVSRKRMEDALRRRAEELVALQATMLDVTVEHDLSTLLQTIVERAAQLLGAPGGGMYLCDAGREEVRCVVSYNTPEDYSGTVLKYGEGAAGTVAETGKPLIIDDYRTWSGRAAVYEEEQPFTSVLSAPMVWQGQVAGVIHVLHDAETRRFTEADLELLTLFASQAAIAVENARLYEEARQRALEQETLREAAMAVTTALERDVVVDRILAQLQRVVPYDTASVQLLKGNRLEIVGGHGFPNLPEIVGLSFPVDEDNPNREVVRTRAPFIVKDGPAVYEEFRHEPHAPAGIRSWLGVPMLVGERLIGMIALDKTVPGFYTQEHARLAEAFAAQAAIAIENARLFQAERGQRELAEALEKAAAAVSGTLEIEEVLDRILEQVARVVAGDAFNVMLVEGDDARVVRQRGYEDLGIETPIAALPVARYPSLTRMARSGAPLVVSDTATDPGWVPQGGGQWLHSYVGAPIRVGDVTVGFLNVNGTRPGQFGPADARRLEAFASHAATAIENARLYRELLGYAGQLEERVQERTAEVQAQCARLDAILNSVADGIVVTDAGGEILQANPVARAWLTQTLSPEEASQLREAVRSAATRMGKQPVELLELTGLDLELRAAPISGSGMEEVLRMAQGEPVAVVDINDISELKALDRMKTRFATNISHELRTPVTAIKLYAELMRRRPEKWREYLDTLAQEADHQARLVEDILRMSRIDAGRLEMQPEPTSLSELTERTITEHQVLARDRGLTLEHYPAESGPVALVDPRRMMQVLDNLVENAIQYTPAGGKVVVSTGEQEAEERVWATATVSDTGVGIPEEEFSHIFERFFRGEGPRSMQVSGTGLGLPIVKGIVELHGGRVTVESEEGVGSTFTVWLPLAGAPISHL